MKLKWNPVKNLKLLEERGITFEVIEQVIATDGFLELLDHPTREHQKMLLVQINNYVYAVPCLLEPDGSLFLKTAFPSRKYKKRYQDG
ncbi:MAG: toxin [bacterium]|nr:toxin [bacterium]